MPPYAGDSAFMFGSSSNAAYANTTPAKIDEEPPTDDSSASGHSGRALNAILDFNPCVSISGTGHSMHSAMFKTRNCSWCGKGCNKIKGYKKEEKETTIFNEETGEDEPAKEKTYYHKWCGQLKEWKDVHSEGWKKVMDGLLGHFRAIALAEQRRKEAEERARLDAIRKADEARRVQEEAARQRRAELEEQRRLEEEQRAAEEAARIKKEASLKYKIGKKFSPLKKAMKNGCKSKKAADESATQEQAP